jgi:hypothetical protein
VPSSLDPSSITDVLDKPTRELAPQRDLIQHQDNAVLAGASWPPTRVTATVGERLSEQLSGRQGRRKPARRLTTA